MTARLACGSLLRSALIVGCGAALAGLICTDPAVAADAGRDSGLTLQEVIVTATRREESVERIPISISALGQADRKSVV